VLCRHLRHLPKNTARIKCDEKLYKTAKTAPKIEFLVLFFIIY